MTYWKAKLDVVVFVMVLCLLIWNQVMDKIHPPKATPSKKLLTTANISKVCIGGQNGVTTCYDVKGMYNILLVKNETENSSQLLLTFGKGQ